MGEPIKNKSSITSTTTITLRDDERSGKNTQFLGLLRLYRLSF
jgi:hypothetical protein